MHQRLKGRWQVTADRDDTHNEILRRLRARMAEVRELIRAELLRADAQSFSDVAGSVPDSGDAAMADLLADVDLASISRHVQEIRALEAAERRLADGGYGSCADCGEAIEARRLAVQPAALRCCACQERHERPGIDDGHPSL
jgi:RNA polymerase-binding transcription factor DksA